MPFSTNTQGYVDVPLTNAAIQNFQSLAGFTAPKVAPRLIVNKPSGLIHGWKMEDFNRDELTERGPNGRAGVATFGTKDINFAVSNKSLAYKLSELEKKTADVVIDPSRMVPKALALKAAISAERMMWAQFGDSTKWWRTVTGVSGAATRNRGASTGQATKFSDQTVDPLKAIAEEIEDQSLQSGLVPTGILFGASTWTQLRYHTSVRAALSSGTTPVVRNKPASEMEMAALLEVPWVGVSKAIYNTAYQNEAPTNARIVDANSMLIFYRGGSPDPTALSDDDAGLYDGQSPVAMVRNVYAEMAGNNDGLRIRVLRDELAGVGGSDHWEMDELHSYLVLTKEMGTLFSAMT